MLRGIYTSAAGMLVQQTRTDLLANNLANVNTTGFKRDDILASAFPDMLIHRINDPQGLAGRIRDHGPFIGRLGTGAYVERSWTSMEPGRVRFTGNPLDLAIEGNGFFTVETPVGLAYTRDGAFFRDAEGWLVTADGYRVLGEGGPVRLAADQVVVDEEGRIHSGGRPIDRLRLVTFADLQGLHKQGRNLWMATPAAGPELPAAARVLSGHLELANVDVATAMVHLITAFRAYEAGQRVTVAQDETLKTLINETGRS